ncbi:hypothetical protein KDU71_07455 [Carboxylicivirga sediminis]|uniref:Uncharacterized protein n=1 Tax=Carboxylicivirga sediminis TaxID=2006564 RepID=A0A941IY33_9BACT|nr:hypothetical protein [Carboxylicivirga sediminis]MBR8535392.1 hypothetical protein [Carboxylicivirga sediminis]
MTNFEAIYSFPGIDNLDEVLVNKILVDRGLQATATYSGETNEFCLAVADLSKHAASLPDFSDGKVSEKISRAALMARVEEYLEKAGVKQTNITDGTDSW